MHINKWIEIEWGKDNKQQIKKKTPTIITPYNHTLTHTHGWTATGRELCENSIKFKSTIKYSRFIKLMNN